MRTAAGTLRSGRTGVALCSPAPEEPVSMAESSLRSRDARRVLVYAPMGQAPGGHELSSHLWVAERLAGLLGMSYGGIGRDTESPPQGEGHVGPLPPLNYRA